MAITCVLCKPQMAGFLLLVAPLNAQSELKPLDDSTLSEVTGQAFISIDQSSNNDISYTQHKFGDGY